MKSNTIYTADNLNVLRGLEDNCVDLIYLDPPYNSNKNWITFNDDGSVHAEFKDAWTLADIDIAWWGRLERENPILYQVIKTIGMLDGNARSNSNVSYCVYMAIRLFEMHRIIKKAGAIVLQCDDVMGPHIRLLLDAIFGKNNLRNVIAWNRTLSGVSRSSTNMLPRAFDYLYYYAKSDDHKFYQQFLQSDDAEERFPFIEEGTGRRYNTKTPIFRSSTQGASPGNCYTYKGVTNPHPSGWRLSLEKLKQADAEGRIIWRDGKMPHRKAYADEHKGIPVSNFWDDIQLEPLSDFKYPTRKPLKLLERIIKMTTQEGDMMLDPFCGCATACVAAQIHNRKWIGIDISEKAAELITTRFEKQCHYLGAVNVNIRKTANKPVHGYTAKAQLKDRLYGECDGECIGCGAWKPHADMDIDHIISQDRGDHELEFDKNKQLLCRRCNVRKHGKPMKYLLDKNLDDGTVTKKYYNGVINSREWPEWDY